MAFLISQNNGGIIPGLEYLPAGAITPKIGMALVMTDGNLAACGATTRPQYICATAADEALDAGTIIPVFRVLEGTLFATSWSAAAGPPYASTPPKQEATPLTTRSIRGAWQS